MKLQRFISLIAILGASPVALGADPQYSITLLPAPPGSTADTPASFSTGETVGASFIGDWNQATGVWQPVLWQGAQATLLPVPAGYAGNAQAINGTGIIAGFVSSGGSTNQPQPAMWTGGNLQLLDPQGLSNGYANAINAQGVIAGALYGANGPNASTPVLWSGGQVVDLGLPAGTTSAIAESINNAGQVLVTATSSNTASAWIWSNGTYTQIPSPSGLGTAGVALNNAGQATGVTYLSEDAYPVSFLYSGGVTTPLADIPGDTFSAPEAINDVGQIVGIGDDVNGSHALLWQNGQVFDLNNLIPAGTGWTLQTAAAIGPDGAIVGQGELDGSIRAFELTPTTATVPEPTSLALLLLGGTLLLKRRQRPLTHRTIPAC